MLIGGWRMFVVSGGPVTVSGRLLRLDSDEVMLLSVHATTRPARTNMAPNRLFTYGALPHSPIMVIGARHS